MELRHLRYVIAIAEELHFGRAAERLRVAQPSLSRQVRQLERDLGVQLFARTSRRVELTPAGIAFVAAARHTLAAAEESRTAARQAAAGVVGTAVLGFVASAAVDILPRVVPAHRSARSQVRLSLREMTTEEQVPALLDGEIDVGIGRDLEPLDELRIESLHREPLIAALPQDHHLHHRRRLSMADLRGSPFVTLPRQRVPRAWDKTLQMCRQAGFVPSFTQEANQFVTLLALVAAGLGVAVVPASVRPLRQRGVRYVPLKDLDAWTEITIAARANETHPTALDLYRLLHDAAGAHET
ncbi:LysR family transcriptional regulator [Amycolatopsis palatopharyngis]|uniref:LysR family transcriptional regulator n=1 Tax=Amycolatopsis palatopharyngis TaxID=187982 RepID=UPI000E2643DB|nr:LysR family transcriptional regulator [Amycolatopsis palatopharyngis]